MRISENMFQDKKINRKMDIHYFWESYFIMQDISHSYWQRKTWHIHWFFSFNYESAPIAHTLPTLKLGLSGTWAAPTHRHLLHLESVTFYFKDIRQKMRRWTEALCWGLNGTKWEWMLGISSRSKITDVPLYLSKIGEEGGNSNRQREGGKEKQRENYKRPF